MRLERLLVAVLVASALSSPKEVIAEDEAAIVGVVRYIGLSPKAEVVPVFKHRWYCGKEKIRERLIVSERGGLKNVLVSVEGVLGGKRVPPREAAVLDNRDCAFVPHVQAVVTGTILEIRNSDPILHSAHVYLPGGETLFNLALPVFKEKVQRPLPGPGLLKVVCDVGHTWQEAYILVSDHPYFAVTDEDGAFRIEGVPPGRYRVKAWHEVLGTLERSIVLSPKGRERVELVFNGLQP